MSQPVRFDDALPVFVDTLASILTSDEICAGVIVRDVVGRLAFTAARELDDETLGSLNEALAASVGRYARSYGAAASGVRDGVAAGILGDEAALPVAVGDVTVRLIDRRLSGGDWLHAACVVETAVPTIVFASMKGGGGRSTALVVSALALVDRGSRVLVLDLDVEAPGLGVMLLSDDELPPFGAVDALMERKLGPLDDAFVLDLVASSRLGGGGLLVCPALGARSLENPTGVLSKIGRIYGEAEDSDGGSVSVLNQLAELVEQLARVHQPDVILVDARAGLHELTAATILGLGSEVLLFGLDEPQTWHAYRILLAQLAAAADDATWMDALTPVQGKAPVESARREAFMQTWRDIITSAAGQPAHVEAPTETLPGDQYAWDEAPDAPADVREETGVAILYDSNYAGFDPLGASRDRITVGALRATFGDLSDHVLRIGGKA